MDGAEAHDVDDDIFAIERLEWSLDPKHGRITALSAGNNTLLIGTASGHAIRFTVLHDKKADIHTGLKEPVYKAFIDPSGQHGIVGTEKGANVYVIATRQAAAPIKGLKNVVIESIAWNKLSVVSGAGGGGGGGGGGTGSILVGARDGSIYEVAIEDNKERSCKKLWTIDDAPMPISGIQMDVFPGQPKKFFVMAATPTRNYQFIGGPSFEALFRAYAGSRMGGFQELPGTLDRSELHFHYNSYPQGAAQRVAWLTQAGIFQGDLVFGAQNPGEKVCDQHILINYPPPLNSRTGDGGTSLPRVPLSIAASKFHYMMLFRGQFVCANRLSRAVVYDISLRNDAKRYGPFRGLASDLAQGTFWMFSDRCVFEVLIEDEERDVWELLLERGEYDASLRHCRGDKKKQDLIKSKQADHFFSKGYYKEAAKAYAATNRPFEEIALKFVNQKRPRALRTYLLLTLQGLPAVAETQLTMVGTWLTELFLDELRQLDDPPVRAGGEGNEEEGKQKRTERSDEKKRVQSEFRRFLEDQYDILDQPTTFALISSHGRSEELVHYAEVIGDRDWLIRHSLAGGRPKMALLILAKYWTRFSTGKKKKATFDADLYFKYAPHLLTHSSKIAKEMVTTLARVDRRLLDPSRLIPAFVRYDTARSAAMAASRGDGDSKEKRGNALGLGSGEHEGIRYFSMVVETGEVRDPTVHNYLVSLLVREPRDDALVKYIAKFGGDPPYDYKNALQLCYHHSKLRACCEIHKVIGEYEEAVQVALAINIQLAQLTVRYAEKSSLPEERTKRLWLLVARHVIQAERNDVKRATQKVSEILKHCSLHIEEVLPYFPDFAKIGAFKNEVVKSLESYNQKINSLKSRMDQHMETAKMIRSDIDYLRNCKAEVAETRRCDLTSELVMQRSFLYFPCGHIFLTSALTDSIIEYAQRKPRALLSGSYAAVTSKEKKFRESLEAMAKEAKDKGKASLTLINITRNEWTKIGTHECPLCGLMMVSSCHDPLIRPDESKEQQSWFI